jgi:hypothetical protein
MDMSGCCVPKTDVYFCVCVHVCVHLGWGLSTLTGPPAAFAVLLVPLCFPRNWSRLHLGIGSSRTPRGSLYHNSELRVFWVSCPRNCKEFNTPVMFRVSTGKESQRDEDCTSRMGGLGSVAMGPFPTAMQEPWSTAHSSLGAPGESWTHGEQCYHPVLQMDKAKGSQMVTRAPQQRLCS